MTDTAILLTWHQEALAAIWQVAHPPVGRAPAGKKAVDRLIAELWAVYDLAWEIGFELPQPQPAHEGGS